MWGSRANSSEVSHGGVSRTFFISGVLVMKAVWLPAPQEGRDGTDEGTLLLLALS